jgi:hypothetical protein
MARQIHRAITRTLPCFALALIGNAEAAEGSGAFGWASQRAAVRAQTRWSLDAWLAARERMKWSDLWLSMNSPSPYEFSLLGAYSLVPESQGHKPAPRLGFAAYVRGFGLEYERLRVFEFEDHGRFAFRVLGNSLQDTHLTWHAGVRRRAATRAFQQWYLGATAELYLTRAFGTHWLYRYHLRGVPTPETGQPSGHRIEAGAFLDYGPLRVQGTYLIENESTRGEQARAASGWNVGIRLFF